MGRQFQRQRDNSAYPAITAAIKRHKSSVFDYFHIPSSTLMSTVQQLVRCFVLTHDLDVKNVFNNVLCIQFN